MKVDAIVNAANSSLLGGGGVDGAIHRAAGPGLLKECIKLNGCETGDAKITKGYNLPCRYVIHTVGPIWSGGGQGEEKLLVSCYRKSLELAKKHHCESVAFPLISSGVYGYPKDQALRVAVGAIREFLAENEMTVTLVIFDRASYTIGEQLFDSISEYIDDRYAAGHTTYYDTDRKQRMAAESLSFFRTQEAEAQGPDDFGLSEVSGPDNSGSPEASGPDHFGGPQAPEVRRIGSPEAFKSGMLFNGMSSKPCGAPVPDLKDRIGQLDESFSGMLLRKIEEEGMTDAECYKKANIDRKLFSKIRSDVHYRPSKQTAIAFALALGLDLNETKEMLEKAGYALSHSSKFDIIIEYFIEQKHYDVFDINEALFNFDQPLLGA